MSIVCGRCKGKVDDPRRDDLVTAQCMAVNCPAKVRGLRPVLAQAEEVSASRPDYRQDPELRCVEQAATIRRILGASDQELAPEAAHRVKAERDHMLAVIEHALEQAALGETASGWSALRNLYDSMVEDGGDAR